VEKKERKTKIDFQKIYLRLGKIIHNLKILRGYFMEHKVLAKQENSKNCLVCGLKNNLGLKASFYELDNNELIAIFTPSEEHQSYPGIMDGGMSGAILDETIGRAIMIHHRDTLGVTLELKLKYKKPVPLNEEIKVIGRITHHSGRFFEGTGEIILKNGDIAVIGSGKYMKVQTEKMAGWDPVVEEWKVNPLQEDPESISY